tara:strand:+ start:2474 stop:2701 length:228 start_codon:yes stop_codon:yes gene_type:complete
MKAINLSTGEERIYSHNEPLMALTQCYASENNLNSKFATNRKALADKIKASVREGDHGFHMGNWSIPKATICVSA